jgi:hypothetical protein
VFPTDGFLATYGMKSAVYRDPPLGAFELRRDVSELRSINPDMVTRSELVGGHVQ